MSILSPKIYIFNSIPLKIPMSFFKEAEQKIIRFVWKNKRPQIAKTILRSKNESVGVTIHDFKLYHRAMINKTTWYWQEKRYTDQWNKIENPEIKLYICTNNFWERGKKHTMEKRKALQ